MKNICEQLLLNAGELEAHASTLDMAIKSPHIAINWFRDSVQAGMFVVEHDSWIKKKCKFIGQTTYYMSPGHALKSWFGIVVLF